MLRCNKINAPVTDQDFPPAEASQLYQQTHGSFHFTEPSTFARSPFPSIERQQQCDAAFVEIVADLACILDAAAIRN